MRLRSVRDRYRRGADFNGAQPTEYAKYLNGWYSITPTGIAPRSSTDPPTPAASALPQLSTPPGTGMWSLRLDGLQIGELGPSGGYLHVGGGELSSQIAVQTWHKINGSGEAIPLFGSTLYVAISRISELVCELEGGLMAGFSITVFRNTPWKRPSSAARSR